MAVSTSSVLELSIERPVAGGRMLARHEGRVVLVAGAIPGERVRARVERANRQMTWATVVDVLEPSPDRRTPPCDPACGGSAYAHLQYARQIQCKGEIIADAFRRIGKISLDGAIDVARSPEQGYRLRARLHVRQRQAGFFRENTHELCDARATGQVLPATMDAVDAVLTTFADRVADIDEIVVAENVAATERVVHIVPRDGARLDDLHGRVRCPDGIAGITTITRGQHVTIDGETSVTDTTAQLFADVASPLPPTSWTRRASSFFQANRFLIGTLVHRVLDRGVGERFVDLYSGVGLFAVALAARGGRGLAVESDRGSAIDLVANAKPWSNRLRVLQQTVEDTVGLALDPAPDLVVLDPPRAGLSPAALKGVTAFAAPCVVYVSCDPPTLARDAAGLIASGYRLESVEAFDLFPNTAHVESVVTFARP